MFPVLHHEDIVRSLAFRQAWDVRSGDLHIFNFLKVRAISVERIETTV